MCARARAGIVAAPTLERLSTHSLVRVLAVGINTYQIKGINQQFAAQDATAIAEAFRKLGAETATLLDRAATRAGMEQALLGAAAQSKSSDTFVFVFTGYGNSLGGEGFYLYPSDVSDAKEIKTQGIASNVLWAWLDKIQAKHILVILDTGDASDFFSASMPKLPQWTQPGRS